MITGIKRKSTAVESTYRFFQTVDLIISHFKREADKKKIFELVDKETNFNNLLIATATIHIYYNLGIRVKDALDANKFTFESAKNLESTEKTIILSEVNSLLNNSLSLEINLFNKLIGLENKFISFLIDERDITLKDFQKDKILNEIEIQIEQELQEIILKYPPFYFYDLLGDLLGFTNKIKKEILSESSALKDLSVEIEKKLESEEKEDKFIELATLSRMINNIQTDFEFKSYKELQTEAMPIRMIKRKILDYNFDRFPISIPGLKAFKEANILKKRLINEINKALNEKINYDQFETEILNYLKSELINKLKQNPNDFIYFLQCLNECSFEDIIYLLKKYGIFNISYITNLDNNLSENVRRNLIRYNIEKLDIVYLNDQKQNPIFLAKKALCEFDFQKINQFLDLSTNLMDFDLIKILNQDKREYQNLWEIIENKTGYKITKLKEFIQKKQAIDKIFLDELKLIDYAHILFILEFEEIINEMAKDVFFYILSKILRQLSRIIESYLKVSNDKSLFLLALKKIYGITESEDWVKVKLEELIINRIIRRQKELVIVFDAINQPFLVNGFILARLKNTSLKEAIAELTNTVSPIYEDIAPLSLKSNLMSPISYCIGYDILKRLEIFEEKHKIEVEQIIESKEKEKEIKAQKLREEQELSTLNWIERRIASSLMRINSPGINPNQLYWQEKDTKIATENIKLHSKLTGNPLELIHQYFVFAIEKIKNFTDEIVLPNKEKSRNIVSDIYQKTINKRLSKTELKDEQEKLLDGERYEIATQIAIRIGRLLDKALYSKFKSKQKGR